ncbi:MAG TPA: DNA methyltransferase [Polyangiaceae bacterium]|nr:DNA methyltransferase [Polyangiaceae bacterium]
MSATAPPSVEIRTALLPGESALLRAAGLIELAPTEAWTVHGTSRALAAGTHGIFRYFGKFPPPIARELLRAFSAPGAWVLDPMAGSGTTAVEALALGRHVVARDVSPLSLLLCRTKTTHVPLDRSRAALERARARLVDLSPSDVAFPTGLKHPEHWFLPDTLASLGRLRRVIDAEAEPVLRELLLAAFVSSVRRVSRATTEQGRLFLDRETARADALPTFLERFENYAARVAALPCSRPCEVVVEEHDVKVAARSPRRFRLAIVHPPYFNNYKYSAINALELAWLGVPPKLVRSREIREAFKVGKVERAAEYVADLGAALLAVERELDGEGTLCVMLGDTRIRNEYVAVTRRLLAALEAGGSRLRLERVILRVPKYTEASWVASQRRRKEQVGIALSDFILVFGRGGSA